MRYITFVAIGLSVLLVSCRSILESHRSKSGKTEGIPYSLPRTVLAVTVTIKPVEKDGELDYVEAELKVTPTYVGDTDQQFVLEHRSSGFFTDKFDIAVNDAGLLTSVNAKSDDQTLAAIEEFGKGIVNAAKIASGFHPLKTQSEASDAERALDDVFKLILSELRAVQGTHTVYLPVPDSFSDARCTWNEPIFPENPDWILRLELRHVNPFIAPAEAAAEPDGPSVRKGVEGSVGGVLVRTPQSFTLSASLKWNKSFPIRFRKGVTFEPLSASEAKSASDELPRLLAPHGLRMAENSVSFAGALTYATGIGVLPDYGPVVCIPLDRPAFAKGDYNLTFKDGMIAKAEIERTSSAANIVKIPVTIAAEIVKIPAELVQFRINLTNGQEELRKKQEELGKSAQTRVTSVAETALEARKAFTDSLGAARAAELKFHDLENTAPNTPEAKNELFSAWADFYNKAATANLRAELVGESIPFDIESIKAMMPKP